MDRIGNGVRRIADAVASTTADAVDELTGLVRESADEVREAVESTVEDARAKLPSLEDVLAQAFVLPGVEVDREEFLSSALSRQPASVVAQAIEKTPRAAGVPLGKLSRMAGKALGKEARRTTVVSMAAGIPGGIAAAATIPTDLVQFYTHLLRAVQMLSYLYGWRDLCHVSGDATSPETRRALVLFLGAMSGDERADNELARLAALRGTGALQARLRAEGAVEQVGEGLEAHMAQRLTGQVVGKSIPIAGAVISGTMSYGGFSDMWKRLRKVLEAMER